MKIGSSIALIVLGAILSFAVSDAIEGVDLTLIGYILMAGGAIGLVLSLMMANRTNKASTTIQEAGPRGTTERRVESRMDGPSDPELL